MAPATSSELTMENEMALTKTGLASMAAACVTTKRQAAVAADYLAWINDQTTLDLAMDSLASAMRSSKSPAKVMANAQVYYNSLEADVPTVSTLSPTTGGTAGGTPATINGKDFNGATAVTFGGSAATSVVVVSDKKITCVTPAHAAGAVTVQVTTPAGSGSKATAFTYA